MGVPPLSNGTLQEVGREGDKVGRGDIGRFYLEGDVTKPVISIQWLFRVAENSRPRRTNSCRVIEAGC